MLKKSANTEQLVTIMESAEKLRQSVPMLAVLIGLKNKKEKTAEDEAKLALASEKQPDMNQLLKNAVALLNNDDGIDLENHRFNALLNKPCFQNGTLFHAIAEAPFIEESQAISALAALRNAGADINAQEGHDGNGTALHAASRENRPGVVEFLAEQDEIDVSRKDVSNGTALVVAAWNGHKDVVNALLESGRFESCINDPNKFGATALHVAVSKNPNRPLKTTGVMETLATRLIANGADKTVKNKNGETADDLYLKLEDRNAVSLSFPTGPRATPRDVSVSLTTSLAQIQL